MKPSKAIEVHRTALRQLIARYGLLNPRIFGSVLRGEDTEESDLDLVVDATSETTLLTLAGAELEAQELLGVRVQLLTPKELPRRSRDQILREAIPL